MKLILSKFEINFKMTWKASSVIVLMLFVATAIAQETCGRIRTITSRQFFDTQKALGVWYPQEVYTSENEDAIPFKVRCLDANFTQDPSDPQKLFLTETYVNMDTGLTESASSTVTTDSEDPAIWSLSYENQEGETEYTDVVWVHTDFDDWKVSYMCQWENNREIESVSIQSRTRTINQDSLGLLRAVAEGYGFPLQNLRLVDQTGCDSIEHA